MSTDLNITFLREKIEALQTAIFFNEAKSFHRNSTHVIVAECVDAAGHIWFVVSNHGQFEHLNAKSFPAKMDFFKKGLNFYVKAKGIAAIVTDEHEIPSQVAEEIRHKVAKKHVIVIRVKIKQAEYFESLPKESKNWIEESGKQIFNWLLNPQYDNKNPQWVAIPITLEP
jgi:hypothetical protein